MGKKELDVQRDICKSVRSENGWARKLSHRTLIGLPDLLVNSYPFIPMLAEVKDLGPIQHVMRPHKLDVTEKQRYELIAYDTAIWLQMQANVLISIEKRWASVLLVGWAHGRDRWLAMLPPDAETIVPDDAIKVCRRTGGYYPFGSLAEQFGRLHRIRLI